MSDPRADSAPFPQSPVVPATLEGLAPLTFRCRKGIACWNACCSNIDIALTPVDIVRLKQHLGLASWDFLKDYTVPYEMEKDGLAGVKLRPVDGGSACRFMTAEGCSVYDDRPTACRYYPVALLAMRKQDEAFDRQYYAIVREAHCLGHAEPRTQTIDAYRAEQGVVAYDEAARGWRQLILKKKSSGPTIGKPSKRSLELFFMTCYDVDRFRAFVASEAFAGVFDLPDEELRAALVDDLALLQFGFRFLRQVLFGETTIALRSDSVEQRRARMAEQRARVEREAAERLARDDDEGGAFVDL
ncbi:MAG: 50S rRNA methyltransferase [Rubrivivax sp. SCN 71-131]|nr:MAG: 50S rRNA methyltransferase [Rubrivivax sp. SCN 71-131]